MKSTFAITEQEYRRRLPDLQMWVGWFVLIKGEQMGGVFPTYTAAAHAWMALYGPVPALIRRIERLAEEARPAASCPTAAVASPVPPAADERGSGGAIVVVCNWAFPAVQQAKKYAA